MSWSNVITGSASLGYDPSFMAGYAKSVVFPASSTLPELVVAAFGGSHPEFAYKVYVLVSAAAVPWLIAWACFLWRVRASATAVAVRLALVYIWTDLPINYVTFGMLPYFLGIPLGLVATGVFARYLIRGGWVELAAWPPAVMSLAVLVHLTTAMVIAPAALLAYSRCWSRRRFPGSSGSVLGSVGDSVDRLHHVGVWLIPGRRAGGQCVLVAARDLAGVDQGPSGFAFYHPEGVIDRLPQIVGGRRHRSRCILLAAGLPGLPGDSSATDRGVALLGFCAAGSVLGLSGRRPPRPRFLAAGPTYLCALLGAGDRRRRRARGTWPATPALDGRRTISIDG